MDEGYNETIPQGTRGQSIPRPGEMPQFFETAEDLEARSEWNIMKPRMSRPQHIDINNYDCLDILYFKGTSNNLNQNDLLLVNVKSVSIGQAVYRITKIEVSTKDDHTKVIVELEHSEPESQRTKKLGGTISSFSSSIGSIREIITDIITPVPFDTIAPRTPQFLFRSSKTGFSKKSDLNTRLITKIKPAFKKTLNQSFRSIPEYSPTEVKVYAFRTKAPLFGFNAQKEIEFETSEPYNPKKPSLWAEWNPADDESDNVLYLDSYYKNIIEDDYVLIQKPRETDPNNYPLEMSIHKVEEIKSYPRTAYGLSAKTTKLLLKRGWWKKENNKFHVLRGTLVFAQSEELELINEPIEEHIGTDSGDKENIEQGVRIELDDYYEDLDSGRWIIVTGERTDIPGAKGVIASELVMLAGVLQDIHKVKRNCDHLASGVDKGKIVGKVIDRQKEIALSGLRVNISEGFNGGVIDGEFSIIDIPKGDYILEIYQGANLILATNFIRIEANRVTELIIKLDLNQLKNSETIIYTAHEGQNLPGDTPHAVLLLANRLAYQYKRDTVTIYGNVVKATHGETRTEVLGSGDSSKALQKFQLRQLPLTYVSAGTPSGIESTLEVRVNEVKWHETDSLTAKKPDDRIFITRKDNKNNTYIIFGNGEQGARIPTGVENVKAIYRVGLGKNGNVKTEQISLLVKKPLGVKKVINPLAATGGSERETLGMARINSPIHLKALDRAVSIQDYTDFARSFTGIGKAHAIRLSDGRREVVHLTIAGADDIPIDKSSDLYRNLQQALYKFGDPHQPLQIELRELMLLIIQAKIRLHPDYLWESVEPRIRSTLLDSFGFQKQQLGQDVLPSEVISTFQAVEGVDYVDLDIFDAVDEELIIKILSEADESDPNTIIKSLGEQLDLEPRISVHTARVDFTTTDPAKRVRPAQMAILSPELPDTLILTELS